MDQSKGGAAPYQVVEGIFGAWLNAPRLHGCTFAQWAAKNDKIRLATFFDRVDERTAKAFAGLVEAARDEQKLALALFPALSDESDVVSLLKTLLSRPSWSWSEVHVPDRFAIDLRYRDETMDRAASAIGFSPSATMPVTRRAPYVGLGLWTGGYCNRNRKRPDEFFGVGDMHHDMSDEEYSGRLKQTRTRVTEVREQLDERGVITGVTFCLSTAAREGIAAA